MNKEIGSWNITSAFTLDLVLFHRQPVEGDNISPLCRVEKQKPLVFQEVHICAFSTRESNLEQAVLTKILSSQTAPPTDRQHLPDPNSQWSWSQRWPGSLVLSEGVCCCVSKSIKMSSWRIQFCTLYFISLSIWSYSCWPPIHSNHPASASRLSHPPYPVLLFIFLGIRWSFWSFCHLFLSFTGNFSPLIPLNIFSLSIASLWGSCWRYLIFREILSNLFSMSINSFIFLHLVWISVFITLVFIYFYFFKEFIY